MSLQFCEIVGLSLAPVCRKAAYLISEDLTPSYCGRLTEHLDVLVVSLILLTTAVASEQ